MSAPNFVLPGTWFRIDLSSESGARSSIRRLVEDRLGRADDRATVRAEMRAELQKAADLARSGEAIEYHIAESIAPGIPFFATLSVHLPNFDNERLKTLELDELEELIVESNYSDGFDLGVESSPEVPPVSEIRVVRKIYYPEIDVELIAANPRLIRFDYWMAAANPARFALLAFATPLVELGPELTELFDAIVRTARWPAAESQDRVL